MSLYEWLSIAIAAAGVIIQAITVRQNHHQQIAKKKAGRREHRKT